MAPISWVPTNELHTRESLHSHRIAPVRRILENHRDNLLAFVGVLDERFADIAARFKVPLFLVYAVCELQSLDKNLPLYWQRQAQLRKKLRDRFDAVETAVREVLSETPRASSLVENLNSRLRNYFFLRRHIGNNYLDLLRYLSQPPSVPAQRPTRTHRQKSRGTVERPGTSSLAGTARLPTLSTKLIPLSLATATIVNTQKCYALSIAGVTQIQPFLNQARLTNLYFV